MELITAIALICQMNFGYAKVDVAHINIQYNLQQKCQTKLAKCVSGGFNTEGTLLSCIGKRK